MADSDDSGRYPDGTPRQLGRYRLVRPISTGGMARVFEGRRESLAGVAPRVAVKVILPQHAHDENFRDLFVNEARIGSLLSHQNVVQIQDFDCEHGVYYLVMEYVEGLTVRKAIDTCRRFERSIPIAVIAEVGRQVCDGLGYAHTIADTEGRPLFLVHRDIKPSNLIAGPQGVVKVLDFGISKALISREKTGAVRGTWGYMAPEQAEGQDVGGAADLYALASVLYEMATLRPLFSERDPTAIRDLMESDEPARRASSLSGPHSALASILVRALQRDPAARFPSAKVIGKALAAMGSDPVTARDHLLLFQRTIRQLDETGRLDEPGNPNAAGTPQGAESSSVQGGLGLAVGNRDRVHQPGASVPVRRIVTRRKRRLTRQARLILGSFLLILTLLAGVWFVNSDRVEDETEPSSDEVTPMGNSVDSETEPVGAATSDGTNSEPDEIEAPPSNTDESSDMISGNDETEASVPVVAESSSEEPDPDVGSVEPPEDAETASVTPVNGLPYTGTIFVYTVSGSDQVFINSEEMSYSSWRVDYTTAPGTYVVTVLRDDEVHSIELELQRGEEVTLRLVAVVEGYVLERVD